MQVRNNNVYVAGPVIKAYNDFYVLLKALPPVCMKYIARGESRVANIAQAKLSAIFVTRPSPRAVSFIQTK